MIGTDIACTKCKYPMLGGEVRDSTYVEEGAEAGASNGELKCPMCGSVYSLDSGKMMGTESKGGIAGIFGNIMAQNNAGADVGIFGEWISGVRDSAIDKHHAPVPTRLPRPSVYDSTRQTNAPHQLNLCGRGEDRRQGKGVHGHENRLHVIGGGSVAPTSIWTGPPGVCAHSAGEQPGYARAASVGLKIKAANGT